MCQRHMQVAEQQRLQARAQQNENLNQFWDIFNATHPGYEGSAPPPFTGGDAAANRVRR
jgi:hypothetical protein